MKTELAYQWDLVEDEIPELYSTLSRSVKQTLQDLIDKVPGAAKSLSCMASTEGILTLYHIDLCVESHRVSLGDKIEASMKDFAYQVDLAEQRFTQDVKYDSPPTPTFFVPDKLYSRKAGSTSCIRVKCKLIYLRRDATGIQICEQPIWYVQIELEAISFIESPKSVLF